MIRIPEHRKRLITTICLAAIVLSAVSIFRTSCSHTPRYNPLVDRALGEQMAAEATDMTGGEGDVVVIAMDQTEYKSVVAKAQMEGFQNGLAKYGSLRLKAVESPDAREIMEFFDGISEQFYLDVARKHPDAKAIVSFMGLPRFARYGQDINTSKLPQTIALNLSAMGQWHQLLKAGVVDRVVLPRYDVRWDQLPRKGPPETLFRSRYLIVTRDNLDEMTKQLATFYPMTPDRPPHASPPTSPSTSLTPN
jgi:hypothetical protein